MAKTTLSETDICDKFITPALQQAGWDLHEQIFREYTLRARRLVVRDFRGFPIPLPSLAEQSRIVACVDALRHLCAELCQRLFANRTTQAHLANAMMAQAA